MAINKPILLVEMGQDNTPSAWAILNELGMAGHAVRRSNVEEVLAYLGEPHVEKPTAVLLDGFEPHENGLNLLRTLKSSERFKSIPVIVLAAGADDPASIDECYRIGVAGYITKSSNHSELLDAVRTIHEYWTLSESPVYISDR
jgi:DNA-binding NarL/FixJ family response regulator